jgi:hypothetical protein
MRALRWTSAATRRALVALALFPLLALPARADEVSGTWTGQAEARTNYYWEESTRVWAPEVSVDLEAPNGLEVGGHYLVDSITSASQAAGTQVDVAFTEIRHDWGFTAGYEFDLGKERLHVGAAARFSKEPDYRSIGHGLNAALSLNDQMTTLRASVFYVHDDIEQRFRGPASGSLSDRGQIGELNALATTLVWDQVLSPVVTVQLAYDFVYNSGFLANPYRQVSVQGVSRQETHPDTRLRHAATGRLAYYHRPSRTAFHVSYRTYLDSWEVAALNPELRIYQEVGDYVMLRGRYRYYNQTRAFFYEADPANYASSDPYFSADPKMSDFHGHTAGIQMRLALGFLRGTRLGWLSKGSVDLVFDRIWRTNRFGNGILGTGAVTLPF